jgi:hypothetical protein
MLALILSLLITHSSALIRNAFRGVALSKGISTRSLSRTRMSKVPFNLSKLSERFETELKNILSPSRSLANNEPDFTSQIDDSSPPYIHRPAIEKQLQYIRDRKNTADGTYFIVAGPRGAGKSTLVSRMFDKPGTKVVTIDTFYDLTYIPGYVLGRGRDIYAKIDMLLKERVILSPSSLR